jgi:D-alanyl-D-alanine carboxypeptidase (penicillin-binding protein 5/6)
MRSEWVRSFASASGRALVCALVCVLLWAAAAQAAATPRVPDARAYYVVNAANGDVLVAHNARAQVAIASITKLMTVLVALQHLKPDDVVTVTQGAAQVGESRIPLYAGQRISVHDLLEGALIQSANNAADALAAAAAGGDIPRFVGWMNARAHRIGLRDTHFVRPDGLDAPGHVSSARDVALLAQVAMHVPIVRRLVATRSAPIENGAFTVHTWNDLLGRFPGLIGVKTGHTDDAGWCQVAAARRAGYTIYAVVLGEPTRAQRNADLARLLSWGVSEYRTATLIRARTYAWASVPYGRRPLALVAPKPTVRVVRRGRPLVEKIVAPTAVSLPVTAGRRLGRVEVWAGTQLVASRPLRAARTVEKPGLGGRLGYYTGRTMHDLAGLFH